MSRWARVAALGGEFFGQGVAQAHVDGAFDLALGHRRVDGPAGVVGGYYLGYLALVVEDGYLRGEAIGQVRLGFGHVGAELVGIGAGPFTVVDLAGQVVQRVARVEVGPQLAGGVFDRSRGQHGPRGWQSVWPQFSSSLVSVVAQNVSGGRAVSCTAAWMQTVNRPWPISVKPVRMAARPPDSIVMAALPTSTMPLPRPTFLMPQAMPA